MSFFKQILLVIVGIIAFNGLKIEAREVPYFRQSDFVGFGLSACMPTSTAMILKYYFPYAQFNPGKIYHSGTQKYLFDDKIIDYYNYGYQKRESYESKYYFFDDNKAYTSGDSSGNIEYLKKYLKKMSIEIINIGNDIKNIKEYLKKGPLLASVHACGIGGGHYVVIVDFDEQKNSFIINDPYPGCKIYNLTRNGYQKLIKANSFLTNWYNHGIYYLRQNNFHNNDYSLLVGPEDSNIDKYVYNKNFNIFGYKYKVYNHPINDWTYKLKDINQTAWYKIYDPWIDNIKGPQKFNEMEVNYSGNIDDIRYYYGGGKSFIYLSPTADTKKTPAFINSVKWKPALCKKSFFDVIYSYYDDGARSTLKFYLKNKENKIIATKEVKYINDKKFKQVTLWRGVFLENGDYIEVDKVRSNINLDSIFFKNVSVENMNFCYNKVVSNKNITAECSDWATEKITPFTLAATLILHPAIIGNNQDLFKLKKQISDIINQNKEKHLEQNYITRAELAKIFVNLFKDKLKYSSKKEIAKLEMLKIIFYWKVKNTFEINSWLYKWIVENKWTTEGVVLKLNGIWNGVNGDMMKDDYVNNYQLAIILKNFENHIKVQK